MDFGLFGINMNFLADPEWSAKVARHAEGLGFESLWTGEHVVLPDPREAPSPAEPETPMLHPPALLAFLAGVTENIKLATGITLIAQRNPVVLAKEMGSLDVLCQGRLLFGVGAGYLHQEFDALGVDFATRGARTDEYIDAMRVLWNDAQPSFAGSFVNFDNIQAQPRPVQAGGPPIIVGGNSPAAMRRAVTHGNGWYGFAMDVQTTAKALAQLELAKARHTRPHELGDLSVSITPPKPPNRAMVEEYANLGVDRLIPMMGFYNENNILESLDGLAAEVM
ncbi:MAG: LLM class F420-dependent oxidoreductase [Pseudomonadales bacterium]|nr:LLM class F420-dependent oxidoreductase [Pseudomonadales bacterium]